MKKAILTITAAIAALVAIGWADAPEYSESWRAYCESYDINLNNPTNEQLNYYLDVYAGSVEEEADLSGK